MITKERRKNVDKKKKDIERKTSNERKKVAKERCNQKINKQKTRN